MNNFHFHTDAKGKDLSKLINNYNLTILNDGTPTMADFATAPDLTLATTEMSPHTTWNPINQSCGSEHLPILISLGAVRLKTGMDRNGPNNRNGPGITGTDLSFTYFFSFPIFIFLLFSHIYMHLVGPCICWQK